MKSSILPIIILLFTINISAAERQLYILKVNGDIDSIKVSEVSNINYSRLDINNVLFSDCVQMMVHTSSNIRKYMLDQICRVSYTRPVLLGDAIMNDPNTTIFSEALRITGFANNELRKIQDANYKTPRGDSCVYGRGVVYNTGAESGEHGYYMEKRDYKYTGLIESDEVFSANGISGLDELKAVARGVYGSNADDNNFTSPNNYLYKFVAYHFLPEAMGYNNFNVAEVTTGDVNSRILQNNYKIKDDNQGIIGLEDFFETLLPHSIMRISTDKTDDKYHLFINRKGYNKASEGAVVAVEGVEIIPNSANDKAVNGIYHYINDLLLYDDNTRNVALNTRMRIDGTTLSPDFINSGGRGGENTLINGSTWMKKEFVKNFKFSDRTRVYVRHRNSNFACYQGDELTAKGNYDIWFKIPPVPFDGTYEVRLGHYAMACRGVVQIYFGEMDDENMDPDDYLTPRGDPIDLRLSGSITGWFKDEDVTDIAAKDKAMRSLGYMKGPDTYMTFRNNNGRLRRILVTEDLKADKNYFIRFTQVLDGSPVFNADICELSLDYIEVVPKSVYNGDVPEDRH